MFQSKRQVTRIHRVYRLFAACALLVAFVGVPQSFARGGGHYDHYFAGFGSDWVGTWATAPQAPFLPLPPFEDQTLRQIVHVSVGGKALRVRLSNAYGTEPIVIDAASVGLHAGGGDLVPGSLRELTFGGEAFVRIPPGARVLSDPVRLKVRAEADLAISLYVSEATEPQTYHDSAFQTSYFVDGDTTLVEDVTTAATTTSWFWLTGVDILTRKAKGAVATLGDSITDGVVTTVDANNRWPDVLARRLLSENRGRNKLGVLNVGIGGNRILNDLFGRSALERLDRDVLTQTGITHVILLEGINDIGIPNIPQDLFPLPPEVLAQTVTTEDIIAGMRQLIARAHARGLKIFGGTILPYKGALYYTDAGEEIRQAVNAWIRDESDFDGVIDFDAAIRDPDDPQKMLEEYDSGDGLHPNDAGMNAMAEAVDLRLFRTHRYH